MKDLVYRHDWQWACDNGHTEQYRLSRQQNKLCKKRIEEEIGNHYQDNCLDTAGILDILTKEFSIERVAYILANTVNHKDWDARISYENKTWARTIQVAAEQDMNRTLVVSQAHPGLVDLLTTAVRKKLILSKVKK